MNKDTLTKLLKNYCYDIFGDEPKKIQPCTRIKHNDDNVYDYEIIISNYQKSYFNYEFNDFVSYIILFGHEEKGYILHFWRNTKDYATFSKNPTKKQINSLLDSFITNSSDYIKNGKPYQMICFGDGNCTYMFLEFDEYFTLIEGYGS